ncbi:transcriptional regulator, AraC family [Lachnospiraceae bacterium KM106-2]|nr:transcriptional regulator, AraC family [Lachnospiraceae bacterium KM106-2]
MTCYDISPGIIFMYCDYHMEYCESKFKSKGDVFYIDYCLEGSFEKGIRSDVYTYQKEKELNINTRKNHYGKFIFPQKHFHGITIAFSIPEADRALAQMFQGIKVSVKELKDKFCNKLDNCIIETSAEIQQLFNSLVEIPEQLKIEYMRVKVVELLLKLKALDIEDCIKEMPYIHKTEIQILREIRKIMFEDIRRFYTIEELANRFGISQTSLKKGFKALYGKPIYTYMKNYRMNVAAEILMEDSDRSIAEVALLVGYDNASKFSAAFSKKFGITPMQHRKKTKMLAADRKEGQCGKYESRL